jgi:hypothetical protein
VAARPRSVLMIHFMILFHFDTMITGYEVHGTGEGLHQVFFFFSLFGKPNHPMDGRVMCEMQRARLQPSVICLRCVFRLL